VLGEAGIGKSRLIHEFLSGPETTNHRVIETGVASFQTEATHSALGTMVRSWCGVGTKASSQGAWEATVGRLEAFGAPDAIRPALRLLLDLPVKDEGWAGLSPTRKGRLVAEALHTLLELEGSNAPVILVFEDAHWVDADTAQVLDMLIEGLGQARALVLITGRPEFRPRWAQQSFVRQIRLEVLDPDETSQFVEQLLGSEQASKAFAARLHQRTGGVPLFLEEIARDLAEVGQEGSGISQDTWDDDERDIPVSVRGVLSARIDRLPADQRLVLQAASTIGPVVAEALLASLTGLPDEQLGGALDGLAAAELLYKMRGFPDREYAFKHALTQEVAYQGILRSRRETLHRELFDLLEQREGTPSEDLARHARLGGNWSKAAHYAALAGDRAVTHSAYRLARVQFERALDALGRCPLDPETRRRMIDLHLRLRAILMVADHSKVLETLKRAEDLAVPLGDPKLLVEIRTHRAFFHATDGRFDDGLAAAELALAEAGSFSDPLLLAEARMAKGQLLRMRGDYQQAIEVLTPLLDVWSGPDRLYRGVNVGTRLVFAGGHLAVCHAYLGHRRTAREIIARVRALAEETQRPADLQFAFLQDGVVTELEGRVADSVPLFERALDIVRSAELPYFEDWILVELGEALLALGEVDRALALLTAADERPGQVAVEQFQALMGAVLGKAQVLAGQTDLAEATLERVLSYARRVGHRQLEQMALRRLSTAVASRDPELAETLIDEAISIAERNGLTLGLAKCLEGKATLTATRGRDRDAAAARERAAALRQVLREEV
ncbi:MAG TPA: AAA family ATPase, partial [Rubellimicrobium sp.]|nr:AAA family ATPase [Rubellimicrobium sp.]